MTIALTNIVGTEDIGEGTSLWTWSGGGSWNLTSSSCTKGEPVPPSYSGTESGETGTGSCSLVQQIPTAFIETLLQDPDGVLDDLVERYHTQSLSRLLCENAAVHACRGNSCLINNYQPLPAPRINQLVIPTGSTRWSYCLLLASDKIKEKIYTESDNGRRAMNLVFGSPIGSRNESDHSIVLTVNILPPRPITPPHQIQRVKFIPGIPDDPETEENEAVPARYEFEDDPNHQGLWLIPVVDERYYWQFKHVGTLAETVADEETDYTIPNNAVNLMLDLAAEGHVKNPGVNPAYDEEILPACITSNDYENLPIVMDSVFAHYGQRLVVDIGCWDKVAEAYVTPSNTAPASGRTRYVVLDGLNSVYVFDDSIEGKIGIRAVTWADSTTVTQSASSEAVTVGKPFLVAGGMSSSHGVSPVYDTYVCTPSSVDIQTTSGVYVNKTPVANSYKTSPVKAIWRTEWASDPPDTLVDQAGRDYFYQFYRQFDYTFAGVQPWQQGYFDDYMVIRQTWNPRTRGYDAYTRVCSRQPNMIGDWVPTQTRLQGIMEDDMPAAVNTKRDPSTARVKVLRKKSNGDLQSTKTIYTLTNRFKNISINKGTYVKFEFLDGEWQPYAADCPSDESSSSSESV
jgi:hypothetical protein